MRLLMRGDKIRLKVRLMSGWKGFATVVRDQNSPDDLVWFSKDDAGLDSFNDSCYAGRHEVALLRNQRPQLHDNKPVEQCVWVLVEDRLPNHHQTVLLAGLTYGDPNRGIWIITGSMEDDGSFSIHGGNTPELGDPTHWAPLPDAPKFPDTGNFMRYVGTLLKKRI